MYNLGLAYQKDNCGLREDKVQARAWYKRAAELHNVRAMASYGEYLLKGFGGTPVPVLGLIFLTRAAVGGSNLAAALLGKVHAKGKYGVPVDTVQAKFWLSQVVDGRCVHKHCKNESIESARATLQEISQRHAVMVD